MKLFEFAIASIVDANTGFAHPRSGGKIDYTAAERHGRAIRGKSVVALFGAIKQGVATAIENYRARAQERRDLETLQRLNDRQLRDIGLDRSDLAAVKYGALTLKQLDAERRAQHQVAQTTSYQIEAGDHLAALNEEVYAEAKCA